MTNVSTITHKLDGIYRAIDHYRAKYLGYRFLVYSDPQNLQVIPAKHGAIPKNVVSELNTMITLGFLPEIHKMVDPKNTESVEAMVLMYLIRFMASVIKENNPKILYMAMYTYDRFAAFKKSVPAAETYILNIEYPSQLDIFATSFDRSYLEQLF